MCRWFLKISSSVELIKYCLESISLSLSNLLQLQRIQSWMKRHSWVWILGFSHLLVVRSGASDSISLNCRILSEMRIMTAHYYIGMWGLNEFTNIKFSTHYLEHKWLNSTKCYYYHLCPSKVHSLMQRKI